MRTGRRDGRINCVCLWRNALGPEQSLMFGNLRIRGVTPVPPHHLQQPSCSGISLGSRKVHRWGDSHGEWVKEGVIT